MVKKRAAEWSSESANTQVWNDRPTYDCSLCQDQEWIVDPENNWQAIPCSCMKQKRLQRRVKNALIPHEFEEARLNNYRVNSPMIAKAYVLRFEEIKDQPQNSMGMIAEVGETQIKRVANLQERAELNSKYNSYGLGKTHLQIAIAKRLLDLGYAVLCISDVIFMHDFTQSKRFDDRGATFDRLFHSAIQAEVLVWDDIGKSKYSEAKEELYYRIINERYKKRRPILFSSNEDELTLSEKIGEAAYSRLYSMAKDYFAKVKGMDYRVGRGA